MATLSQVARSPGLYALKALSILRHQSWRGIAGVRNLRYRLIAALTPVVTVDLGADGRLFFHAPSLKSMARASNMLLKEPTTNAWIDGFEEGCLFWDIGANVGIYSFMAARRRGARVLAFEPLYSNYYNLVRNIELNGMGDVVSPFCVALAMSTRTDHFFVRSSDAGYSGNVFGRPIDQIGNSIDYGFKLEMLGFSIDDFIRLYDLEVPDHIKIDVDGIELDILKGAHDTLQDRRLKSVLVELQQALPDQLQEAISLMEDAGFHIRSSQLLVDDPVDRSTNYIFARNKDQAS
jgi:FkbM family methyltransferase